MVWPPPKVLATPEGEANAELSGTARSVAAGPPPPNSQGVTGSTLAATEIPADWLARPEGLIGGVLGSRYRITSVLGRGPMGIACEAESSRGRQVTVKLLPRSAELPLEHFAWQVRQTLALAHFDHPHVAPINDFGALSDGSAFVSRGRVPGVTLRTILRGGGLPVRRALSIARQIASALAAAHARDIAHGRLKPENVLVQGGAGPGDLIKVVDFGIAGIPVNLRAVAPNEDEARRLALRTRLYLPADLTGASPAIDVYSLGVISFEMIAGQPPFVLDSFGASGPNGPPLSFAQCNTPIEVPPAVNDLVLGMLHPEAARHGLDAQRLVTLLDALLARHSVAPGEPVTLEQPSSRRPAASREPSAPLPTPAPAEHRAGAAAEEPAEPFWPPSEPPARRAPISFPPLPQGFSTSTPAPVTATYPGPPAPHTPPLHSPPAPPVRASAVAYPPPTPAHDPASLSPGFDTQNFAPPSLAPHSESSTSDDLDADFRPSLFGKLRRLFGKSKPPSGF